MALDVLVGDADGVRTITLHRPDELNAWTYPMEHAFFAALDDARHDEGVRVVVVTGSGRGFCAGAALSILTPEGMSRRPPAAVRRRLTELVHFPKPIVAVVNGAAAGMGLALALACDVRIAAAEAKLTTSFVRRGLVAEHGAAWLLTRLVGRAHATELLLSGRVVTGAEAARIGLVTAAVPRPDLAEHAGAYIRELAALGCPASWAVIKEQLAAVETQTVDEAYLAGIPLMEASQAAPDFAEGVEAYRGRRTPSFAALPATYRSAR